jgi:hypothetical protein
MKKLGLKNRLCAFVCVYVKKSRSLFEVDHVMVGKMSKKTMLFGQTHIYLRKTAFSHGITYDTTTTTRKAVIHRRP